MTLYMFYASLKFLIKSFIKYEITLMIKVKDKNKSKV